MSLEDFAFDEPPQRGSRYPAPDLAGFHPAPLGGTGLQFEKRVALGDGDKRRGGVGTARSELSLTGSMPSFYPTGVTRARFPT